MSESNRLAGTGKEWVGAAALKGGKGYASGPLGQIHYRSVGEGAGAPVLLIHQTPLGIAQYIDVQPAIARAGRRAIASDNPGFGLSDPAPKSGLSVADLADNLIGLLDHLKVDKVVIVGHHTGAAIAACFGARHKVRTAGVVLHGSPLYTAAERAERLARPTVEMVMNADGSHLSESFQQIFKYTDQSPKSLASATWGTLGALMAGPDVPTYKAVFGNDMAPDIAAITAPTMILTDTSDSLHRTDKQVSAMRPDFTLKVFSDGGSFALMHEPERWARTIVDFADENGL